MADEIDIAAKANAPASATNPDGQQFAQHNLKDLIEAKKFLAGQAAAAQPNDGIRFSQIVPPGARD